MVTARIKAGLLKQVIKPISATSNEAVFDFAPDGLKVHVKNVDVNLNRYAFNFYVSAGYEMGMFVDRLDKILSDINDDTIIELRVDEQKQLFLIRENYFQYTTTTFKPQFVVVGE